MKKDGISIIIPCYNVEKYIEKCIDEIENQDFKNIQVILVNDCSTDNTKKIINKIIKNTKLDIKFIDNNENRGAGYSRNEALKIAKFDYVSFIDADDYIESNFFMDLFSAMKKDNSDIATCDIFIRYKDGSSDIRSKAVEAVNYKRIDFINNGLAASPCNKLFKKELLIKYPFAEGIMNEDIPAVISCLVFAKKISYVESTFYNYVQHNSSVQNSSLSIKKLDLIDAIDITLNRIKSHPSFTTYRDVLIYNQIICFFLYVPPKEKNIFKRSKFLRKFYKKTHKYKIRRNIYFWNFLETQSRKYKYYYKILLKLNDNGFSFLSSLLILVHDIYKGLNKKSVIKSNLTIDDLIKQAKKQSNLKSPKHTLTVSIPNYNYSKFLYQRLYSILYQNYKINEIVILDDCSTDDSRDVINDIVSKLSKYINIKSVYNENNSGSAFKQWQKGFENAQSEYVWIAEADDYCDKTLVKSLMKFVDKDESIMVAYVDTAFIDKDGYKILRTIKPEIDILKTGHWNKDFINNGLDEIKDYSYLNCTIANVSSVIFKNGDYNSIFKECGKFRQAGDWLFYVKMMQLGSIAFKNKPLNYYRVHGNNVTSLTKKQLHFDEIKKVHLYISKFVKFTKKQEKNISERYKFLEKVWGVK